MTLYDKYGIIENHLVTEDIKTVTSKIENYFENYICSDVKVLIPDYIDQSIYFNKINIEELKTNIQSFIKDYLIQRRNNIRNFIKKELLELSDITKFLKNFISKIQYISNLFKTNTELLSISNSMLNNIIISDSIILIFIEEQVISFNKDIKELLLFIKTFDSLCLNDMYIKMIKLFGSIYKKKIINNDELPIPINLRRMQKLNNTIKYYHTINNYYNFIKENVIEMNFPIFKLILENLIDIIKYNTLEEIEHTLSNNWSYIQSIKNYKFDDKDNLITIISNELINRCSSLNTIKDVEVILKINKFSSQLIRTSTIYNEHNILMTKMSESIINYFKPDDDELKVINFINHFINDAILDNHINHAVSAIIIIGTIKNTDVFINDYYNLLVRRLMNKISLLAICDFEDYIYKEKCMINYLSKIKNNLLLHKFNKVISDTIASFYENNDFNNSSNKLLKTKLSVITTSYNNWSINQNEGIIDHNILNLIKNTELGKYLKYYELYYLEKHTTRIINWFPHFGEINITYLNQKLKMLPIQFMIVEMFTDVNQISIHEIINSKILINYSEKFKTDILNSIIISGLFIMKDDNIILSKSDSIKNDLIEIFLNTSDYPNIWEQQDKNELAYSRLEIVNTVINHIIKTNPKSKLDLYFLVKKEITLFKLDNDVFEKSLKYLIEMDYIILNDKNEYEKLFY